MIYSSFRKITTLTLCNALHFHCVFLNTRFHLKYTLNYGLEFNLLFYFKIFLDYFSISIELKLFIHFINYQLLFIDNLLKINEIFLIFYDFYPQHFHSVADDNEFNTKKKLSFKFNQNRLEITLSSTTT